MTKTRNGKKTTDGLSILKSRYLDGHPSRKRMLAQVQVEDAVSRKIFDLRTSKGLSQRQLAKLVGTTASVICRLEDADYSGHSLSMLHRIAAALNAEVKINFVVKKRAA